MKNIQILMSTYNGEKYLKEQLDSILNQNCEKETDTKWYLLIRDDGSRDSTTQILEEYAQKYPKKITWYQGKNIGVIKSFFALLKKANRQMDYIAFSDQDDVWQPDKLTMAIKALEGKQMDKPMLYCCRPQLVDEKLNRITSKIKRPPMRPGFGNALIENICTGCTAVLNAQLFHLLLKKTPEYTVMHDWWFYLTASCFGEVIYDETPHIYYRQHGGNVVGTNAGRMAELKERIKRFKKNRRNISRQTEEFLRVYEEEFDKSEFSEVRMHHKMAQTLLEGKKSRKCRNEIVKNKLIYRQRKNDDRIFKIILHWGSY